MDALGACALVCHARETSRGGMQGRCCCWGTRETRWSERGGGTEGQGALGWRCGAVREGAVVNGGTLWRRDSKGEREVQGGEA